MIENIQKHVKEKCRDKKNIYGMNPYDYHFKSVAKYGKELADRVAEYLNK